MTDRLGVLTMAFGPVRFRRQAIALAQSLALHAPSLPRACITDVPNDPELSRWFEVLIPMDPSRGKALQQKLHFDLYTPYARTAFIDSDCLVTGPLDAILSRCQGQPFAVLGIARREGWWYMDIAQACARYRLDFIPHFNGGFYYFERSDVSDEVFCLARRVGRLHSRMGIYDLKGWFNEEVMYAFALAACRIPPIEDTSRTGMYTPDEFTDPLTIDALGGGTHFVRNGQDHRPVIAHFFGNTTKSFHYLRERGKLGLWASGAPAWRIELYDRTVTTAYRAFVATYNLSRRLQGKQTPYKVPVPFASLTNFWTKMTSRFFE